MAAGTRELIQRLGTAVAVAVLVAACVPPDMGRPEPPVRPVPPAPAEPLPAPRTAPPVSPASQTLLSQSRAHQAAGRWGQAAASIERALRIEPRQPVLWLELGTIRLKEGDFAQAESIGRKALSLATGDAALTARAEQLITTARKR